MITKDELKEYAKLTGLNLGQAEKDYFQNVVLFILYREYGSELVFKGGTALKKCYGLPRFSEDLDFTCLEKIDLKKMDAGLRRFNLEFETEVEDSGGSTRMVIRIRGPLYNGLRQSLCRLVIDLSYREVVVLRPSVKTIGRFLEEIPAFDVFVMQEKEILAEKVRAVMKRAKARDVYDLWFLLGKGVAFDMGLVEKKLQYYGERWARAGFIRGLEAVGPVWESELRPVLASAPGFTEAVKLIKQGVGA